MFSATMPFLHIVTALQFCSMYWIDKLLILRFYKSPKNFDESTIKFTLYLMKYCFFFHLVMGVFMLSNEKIISSPYNDNILIDII